jgi:hypothetical protein
MNAAVTVIALAELFTISGQLMPPEMAAAATARTAPGPAGLLPLIGHSLPSECSRFSQSLPAPGTLTLARRGHLLIGE